MNTKKLVWMVVLFIVAALAVFFLRKGDTSQGEETGGKSGSKHKIGIVFDQGGRGDLSFNDSAYEGLVRLARDFKGYMKQSPDVNYGNELEIHYIEPQQGGQDQEVLLRRMAEEGFALVIGVGFAFSGPVPRLASEYPDTYFSIVDGSLPEVSEDGNVSLLIFKEQEGSFLVGALAAMMTKSDKIGFIGGLQIPLIDRFLAGYIAGAVYVNPALADPKNRLVQYVSTDLSGFADPKAAESIARAQYNQGADVIYHAAGGSGFGLFKAAAEAKKWAIGVDSDQGLLMALSDSKEDKRVAEYILSSMVKRVDKAVYAVGKEYVTTGHVSGGFHVFGLEAEGVTYALNDYNKEKLSPLISKLNEIDSGIVKGEIVVPKTRTEAEAWVEEHASSKS